MTLTRIQYERSGWRRCHESISFPSPQKNRGGADYACAFFNPRWSEPDLARKETDQVSRPVSSAGMRLAPPSSPQIPCMRLARTCVTVPLYGVGNGTDWRTTKRGLLDYIDGLGSREILELYSIIREFLTPPIRAFGSQAPTMALTRIRKGFLLYEFHVAIGLEAARSLEAMTPFPSHLC